MRVLITGATGFAGSHLARACEQASDEVIGVHRSEAPTDCGEGRKLDLVDQAAVRAVLRDVRPEVVYHLAALSSVGRSWEEPARTLAENVASAVNVLEGVRLEVPGARVVWVSSCEVYGTSARLPTDEGAPLAPANPYAVSKAAGDQLAAVYAEAHSLNLVRARPFNHAGPGQLPVFIVSSLARQLAEGLLAGARPIRIVTGNPRTRRDFTDVRDVARAYRLLAAGSQTGIYNVCSSRSISAAEQVAVLAGIAAPVEVEHEVDPTKVRATEVIELRGANDRIAQATGWRPEIPFEQTLRDTVEWWQRELEVIVRGRAAAQRRDR